MKVLSLSELLEIFGEDRISKTLSKFSVSRDKDVQNFIRNLSIPYEKSGNARTFIFQTEEGISLGFISLALSTVQITSSISATLQKKIRGFGKSSAEYIPCYLIGQIARFDNHSHNEFPGELMFEAISTMIDSSKSQFGGRIVSIDCKDSLIEYYKHFGFQVLNRIDDLNQMIAFI